MRYLLAMTIAVVFLTVDRLSEFVFGDQNMINLKAPIKKPRSAITCSKYNYLEQENRGKVQVRCDKCKDQRYCVQAV